MDGKLTKPEGVEYAGPDEFAAASKRRYADEEIPGFGWIRIQNLSDFEIGEWEIEDFVDGARTDEGMKLMKAGLIVRCLVNGQNERRFHPTQRLMVSAADGAVVNATFEKCREHCGITRRDIDAIAALKFIQKKSEATTA